ncbi:Uncharacterised protein [Mycobacteroides abscessus subsp. abscessus]|nr:Uncharacterised protein [Mycobacteroides abscessus subsp. abscessus]
MACTSSRAVASSLRSALRRPLPDSASMNFCTCPATWARATPRSRAILRKKKSCAWIAVVPS